MEGHALLRERKARMDTCIGVESSEPEPTTYSNTISTRYQQVNNPRPEVSVVRSSSRSTSMSRLRTYGASDETEYLDRRESAWNVNVPEASSAFEERQGFLNRMRLMRTQLVS